MFHDAEFDLPLSPNSETLNVLDSTEQPAVIIEIPSNSESPPLIPTYSSEFHTINTDIEIIEKIHSMPSNKPVSVLAGVISVNNSSIPIDNVLLDTGAIDKNYINPKFLNLYPDSLKNSIRYYDTIVRLADNKTTATVIGDIHINLSFPFENSIVSATVKCMIFETAYDLILGLPDICRYYSDPICHAIKAGKAHYDSQLLSNFVPIVGQEYPLFDETLDPAPEDSEEDLPCAFSYALDYLGVPIEVSVNKYIALVEERIGNSNPKLKDLLVNVGQFVYVPRNWEGIRVPPIELSFKDSLPSSFGAKFRHVNARILPTAKEEFDRLCKYMYLQCDSITTSPTVIASKPTPPYCRFCGDYVFINTHIEDMQGYIPIIIHELEKMSRFCLFTEADMTNSFHQFLLALKTSLLLALTTMWGIYRPLFLPEGVKPASFILMNTMRRIFKEYEEWTVIMFDNLMILAHDNDDMIKKLDLIFKKCIEFNIYLKFSKSQFCVTELKFFGYIVSKNSYKTDPDRYEAILKIPFPTTIKKARSFVGLGVFFSPFILNYADKAAPIFDMLKKDFDFNPKTWKIDYKAAFESLKTNLADTLTIFYPNYDLQFVLRTDASMIAVGCILFQEFINPDGSISRQPLAIHSSRFSPQACGWETIKQEAYGIYSSVKRVSYYLFGKACRIETDHANLVFIEKSVVPMIVRWRIYMQQFFLTIIHFPGKSNYEADYFTRDGVLSTMIYNDANRFVDIYNLSMPSIQSLYSEFGVTLNCMLAISYSMLSHDSTSDDSLLNALSINVPKDKVEEAIRQVHNEKNGHNGTVRTMRYLDRFFPNHGIPYSVVYEYVESCPVCQKDRINRSDLMLRDVKRNNKKPAINTCINMDDITITPKDKNGNCGATVIANAFSRLVKFYPWQAPSAKHASTSVLDYFVTYGITNEMTLDPGSVNTSLIMKDFNNMFDSRSILSLVGVHTSNNAEPQNKLIADHLRALIIATPDSKNRWSDEDIRLMITFLLNSSNNSEIGKFEDDVTPYSLTFGTLNRSDWTYPTCNEYATEYIKLMNDNFRALHKASFDHQQSIVAKRLEKSFPDSVSPGDLVLKKVTTPFRATKLTCRFQGPFKVTSSYKNDISCMHLCMHTHHKFHITDLKRFFGSESDAMKLAMLDHDEFWLKSVKAWLGHITIPASVRLLLVFDDDTEAWTQFDGKLIDTEKVDAYIRATPELAILAIPQQMRAKFISSTNAENYSHAKVGFKSFLDLRYFGFAWFENLGLPNIDTFNYIVEFKITKLLPKKHFTFSCPVLDNVEYKGNNFFLLTWGYIRKINPDIHILVDLALISKYPSIGKN